ncbi:hypothetical protein, partial [Salmonella enterica]|uniref:hypothetical protein n=1 Tax=Salmonella enterica TaxID=28901 RepID=UPI00398C79FD
MNKVTWRSDFKDNKEASEVTQSVVYCPVRVIKSRINTDLRGELHGKVATLPGRWGEAAETKGSESGRVTIGPHPIDDLNKNITVIDPPGVGEIDSTNSGIHGWRGMIRLIADIW